MDLNLDLNLVQSQKILLTPKLKQALEILEMNSQELFEYIEEQLESNPVLEILENEVFSEDIYDSIADSNIRYNSQDITSKDELQFEDDLDELNGLAIDKSPSKMSLKEHLTFQLHISGMDDKQIAIGEYLIDNINKNGYLIVPLPEVARFFNIHINKVKFVLRRLQLFDPPGICARSLKECLIIQLKQMNCTDKNVYKIVEEYLAVLGAGKFEKVAEDIGLEKSKVIDIFNFIKTMEPKPGRAFYNIEDLKFNIQDIMVKKERFQMQIVFNEEAIPLLNIDEYYRKILLSDVNNEVKKYIQVKMENAVWLLRCIEQRKSMMIRVSEYIVNKETEFFEKGKAYLKLLPMKDSARDLDIHESILYKVVNGKYIQCVWGVFEMRCFFKDKE